MEEHRTAEIGQALLAPAFAERALWESESLWQSVSPERVTLADVGGRKKTLKIWAQAKN